MVIATGMDHAPEKIEGFDEAWAEFDHPVYAAKDHPSWKGTEHKYARWHYNYTSGDAIFTIPPYPYSGELENFNFFNSTEVWKWFLKNGKLSPINSFTVINANESFCHHNITTDQWIKAELAKRGVNVVLGENLTAVDKKTQMATFTNMSTGETSQRNYDNLYSILPCKP